MSPASNGLVHDHADVLLMHVGNFIHERHAHVFLHLIYSVEQVRAWLVRGYQGTDFESIEGWAHVIVVFVDFIIVEVQSLEFREVPQF